MTEFLPIMNDQENKGFETLWKGMFGDQELDKRDAVKLFINHILEFRALNEDLDRLT